MKLETPWENGPDFSEDDMIWIEGSMRITDVRKETSEGLMDEWEKLFLTRPSSAKEVQEKYFRLHEIIEEIKRRFKTV